MLSERFLCLCFGSFLKSENWGLPPVTWHCQCLFDAFSPTLLYMSLKDTVLVVWSLFHCYIFLVNCSFISIWSITISFLRFHSSCQFIWYHYWLLCPHTQLFFFFFSQHLSGTYFSAFHFQLPCFQWISRGMYYCFFILSECLSISR